MSERIIYNSTREGLVDFLCQLQRLREEGKPCIQLEDEAYNRLIELVEKDDGEKLQQCRQELETFKNQLIDEG